MSEHFQPGQHPDADRLSAFADNALPAHERQETLAHLAQCAGCRSVVYLAQEAALEDQPTLELVPPTRPMRKPWFAGWALAWRAAAAFACLVLAALYTHHLLLRGSNVASTSIASNPSTHVESKVGQQPLPPKDTARQVNQRPSGKAATVVPEERKSSSSSYAVHGTTVQTLPLSGRQVSELSQLQMTPAPGSRNGAIGKFTAGGRVQGNAPAGYAGGIGAGQGADFNHVAGVTAKKNTVPLRPEVNASASAIFTTPAAAPPAATSPLLRSGPVQLSSGGPIAIRPSAQSGEMATLSVQDIVSDSHLKQQFPQQMQFHLPSHLPTVSTISNARLILAIDSGGTLFASQDAGKRWKSISPRWTGHAVKVNFAPNASYGTMEAPTATKMQISRVPAAPQYSIQNVPQAQAATGNPSLTGVVTDGTGAVIPNATVVAANAVTAQSITAETDGAGRYGFGNLKPGVYTVTARSPGFSTQTLTGIEMADSQAVVRNIALDIGAATQTVTVQAENSSIQTESTNLNAQIVDQEAANVHPAVFELTTETGEVWTSTDGRHWKHK